MWYVVSYVHESSRLGVTSVPYVDWRLILSFNIFGRNPPKRVGETRFCAFCFGDGTDVGGPAVSSGW